ncbi:MAG: hypothetical protein ACFFBS_10190 [Promethearchaeota archaeon]
MRSEFRFAVGSKDSKRSSIWKVWAQKDDVYIQSRMMGCDAKVSLHRTGMCQFSLTTEWVKKKQARNTDRHMIRWQLDKPVASSAIHIFRILIPESELRDISIDERVKKVTWIDSPAIGSAALVECYLSPPASDISNSKFPYDHLASFQLADSRWFVMLVHYETVLPESIKQLKASRLEIAKLAQNSGIELKPKFRAVAFTEHGNEPLKGLIELAPYQ